MTVTVDYAFSPAIRRRCDAAAWYVDGDAHAWAATVYDGERFVHVYADGEMRVHLWSTKTAMLANSHDYAVLRYGTDLIDNGIRTDRQLYRADDRMEWGNNAWFALYAGETGEHLECVEHSLRDAVAAAVEYLRETAGVTA